MRGTAEPFLVRGSSSRQPLLFLLKFAKAYKKPKPRRVTSGLSGAATRIRTGDLILTKDVLYQLSHSSMPSRIFPRDADYYNKYFSVCQYIFEIIFRISSFYYK